jgi:DNA-directed RNA polymerase specialized sigma24 family protein
VQELFIKIWTSGEILKNVENHRAYIFRMVANKTTTYLKGLALNIWLVENAAGKILVEKNTTEEAKPPFIRIQN